MPDFSLEDAIDGVVCGLDEVGRGPLAGPVVAACVVVPDDVRGMEFVGSLRDSKKLSKKKLVALHALITAHCPYAAVRVEAEEIDRVNILQASLLAMARSLEQMDVRIDHALVDGNKLPDVPCPATAVIKGDNVSSSIAAASIVAKVTRDRIMADLAVEHPHYGWERNAAYPTKEHLDALKVHGVTMHHRRSFAPVKRALG